MSTPEPSSVPGPAAADLDTANLDTLAQDLTDVEVALRRLDEGTYGTCEVCGVPLDAALLQAFPGSRRCPSHGDPNSPDL